jgi:hypothetical protein
VEIIAILAQIVAWGDEIRKNMKAKGEEAAKQFEEAVARNKKSFAEIVGDLGGDLSDIPPEKPPVPEEPPDVPPLEPPNEGAIYDAPINFEPTRPPYKTGDHKYKRNDGRWFVISRDFGVVSFVGATYVGDVK